MTTNKLELTIPDQVRELVDPTKWAVLKNQVFPDAQDDKVVALAVQYCAARNLDVMKKPVHIVKFYDRDKGGYVEQVLPGINELLTTASRTGDWAGKDRTVFGAEKTFNMGGQRVTVPESAEVTVYRFVQGHKIAFTEEVFYIEKVATKKGGGPNAMWSKSPRQQMSKCALAAALRIAFPEEIGAMAAAEELDGQQVHMDDVSIAKDAVQGAKEIAKQRAADEQGVDAEIIIDAEPTFEDKQEAAAQAMEARGRHEDAAAVRETKYIESPQIQQLVKAGAASGRNTNDIMKHCITTYNTAPTAAFRLTVSQYEEAKAFFSANPVKKEEGKE